MGFFDGNSQTQTTSLNPATNNYVQRMRDLARGFAGIPRPGALYPEAANLPPGILNAQQQYGQYADAGTLGLGSLTGQNQAFMNPYLSQMNPFFQQQRQQAVEGANQQATLANAFGGDRSQIGAATAGNLADQNQAAFNYQGFNDAQQRALQAANLGFGAIGAQAFLPQQYASGQLGLLNQGLGPYGTMTTQQTNTSPWQQLLGIGLTAGGFLLGGPPGAAAGAAAGNQFGGGSYGGAINK